MIFFEDRGDDNDVDAMNNNVTNHHTHYCDQNPTTNSHINNAYVVDDIRTSGAVWSPSRPGQLLSFSGDGTARVLDIDSPAGTGVMVSNDVVWPRFGERCRAFVAPLWRGGRFQSYPILPQLTIRHEPCSIARCMLYFVYTILVSAYSSKGTGEQKFWRETGTSTTLLSSPPVARTARLERGTSATLGTDCTAGAARQRSD